MLSKMPSFVHFAFYFSDLKIHTNTIKIKNQNQNTHTYRLKNSVSNNINMLPVSLFLVAFLSKIKPRELFPNKM